MKAAAVLIVAALLGVSSCATSVPARIEVADEKPTANDPNAKIVCPAGSEKRIAAEFYRDLDPTRDPEQSLPPPEGYTLARMLHPPTVVYPRNILGLARPGFVSVMFTVDIDGSIAGSRIVCSSSRAFEQAALEAVQTARFAPSTMNGEAVAGIAILPIVFAVE